MSEYYGVSTPSSDFFMHYGVKGMKWGVRKAIERGNSKALARHYQKAAKKLNRFNRNADIDIQKASVSKSMKRAAIGTGIAGAGIGGSIGLRKASKRLLNIHGPSQGFNNFKPIEIKENTIKPIVIKENFIRESFIPEKVTTWDNVPTKTWNGLVNTNAVVKSSVGGAKKIVDNVRNGHRLDYASKAAKIIGLGALGYTGYNVGKAAVSAYRRTKKGHAKAVAKRDAWRNEMAEVFKGTKYSKKGGLK